MLEDELHMPKWCRQPRSRIRTPTAFCPSSLKDSVIEVSSAKDESSSSSANSKDESCDVTVSRHIEARPEISLFPCSISWKGPEGGIMLKSIHIPVTEIEPVPRNSSPNSCENRNIFQESSNHVNTHSSEVPLSPAHDDLRPSTAHDTDDAWLTPGNVVWAKAVYHEWWPAEVVDEKVAGWDCTSRHHAGHVLVQLFGKDQHAWLDPAGDLTQFNYCYEERSQNPSTAFKHALKQALCKHVHASPRKRPSGCSDELKSSTPPVGSLDSWNTPSPSRTEDDCVEGGRGRRKRKQKIHFDELIFEEKPRKLRRLKIMRNLGLIAPAGSPFVLSQGGKCLEKM